MKQTAAPNARSARALAPIPPDQSAGRPSSPAAGFTIIELLVVISIIVVLASLLIPAVSAIKKKRMMAVAQTELKQVETAIQDYKLHLGFYPPDNPGNPRTNQLYFELEGTQVTNVGGVNVFVTLDGSSQIAGTDLGALYQTAAPPPGSPVAGFMNCAKNTRGSDETSAAQNFLPGLKPSQIGIMSVNGQARNALLVCSVKWPTEPGVQYVATDTAVNPHATDLGLNPWGYVSSNPTNNPGSYDLWVDLVIGKSIYRVSNWSAQPEIVGSWPIIPPAQIPL